MGWNDHIDDKPPNVSQAGLAVMERVSYRSCNCDRMYCKGCTWEHYDRPLFAENEQCKKCGAAKGWILIGVRHENYRYSVVAACAACETEFAAL